MDTTITLPAGGKLHASRSHLCLAFEKTRFSLSTAIYGGGFKEINYAVNQKLETFYPSEDRFPGGSVPEFLRLSILENGYDPAKACALLTAAKMEWRSVKTFSHKELLLDAVTTGGAEKTAARAIIKVDFVMLTVLPWCGIRWCGCGIHRRVCELVLCVSAGSDLCRFLISDCCE